MPIIYAMRCADILPPMRAALLACLGFAAGTYGQVGVAERQALDDALFIGNLTRSDLNYARRTFASRFDLPLVNLGIDRPLEAADALMALHQRSNSGGLASMLRLAIGEGMRDAAAPPVVPLPSTASPTELQALPDSVRVGVAKCLTGLIRSNQRVRAATSKLSPDELRELVETLPIMANEEPSITFGFTKRKAFDRDRVVALLQRVDLTEIRRAAAQLAADIEAAMPDLRKAAAAGPKFHTQLRVDGLQIDIAGIGDDIHDSTAALLTIDLGGNDRYTGRVGAGVGYSSVCIDLSGDDIYDVPDLSLGAGVVGIGLAYDLGGSDAFRGRSLTQGCGIAGVGALLKQSSGNDSYEATSLAQGYGEFGIGLLVDSAGSDTYRLALNGQGAARTGGLGWLVDREGNDIYQAGGKVLNAPLFAAFHYSNAQGYASGYREDSGGLPGGIGLLTDLGGDDHYLAETYAQAASYWYSLGSLYDGSGSDLYSADHYAQASAMHATSAYLFDLAGDDRYVLQVGAGQAIGHDDGVALLLDRSGDDVYAGKDSRPGTGNANGVGIFVDSAGDDRYLGIGGAGNPARGAPSLGVFVDMAGADKFADSLDDGYSIVSGSLGIAYDASAPSAARAGDPPTLARPTAGSLACPSDAELERLYRVATQWQVGTAASEVSGALNQLIAIGPPAFRWMVEKRLATADRLQLRAFVTVVAQLGAESRLLVVDRIASKNLIESQNALRLCADAQIREAGSVLSDALLKPFLRRYAARAAGAIGSKEPLAELMAMAGSDDRLDARAAAVALSQIGDQTSIPTAQALLSSPDWPTRKVAVGALGRFASQMATVAADWIRGSDEMRARQGLEILGLIGSPEALKACGLALQDPRAGVQVSAMLALSGRVPDEFRMAITQLRLSKDRRVAAVASRIELGK